MSTIIALIPLRGGSKSIPLKNIRLIAGKPLCYWVLEAAVKSGIFDRIIVSTDSEKIREEVSRFGFANVLIDRRPAELSTDTASTESVMIDIMGKYQFDLLCTIQATSPLTEAADFTAAYDLFQKGNYDSLLTGVRSKRFFWNVDGSPINYDPLYRPRRQDFQGCIVENGAFYITKREILEKFSCRLGGKTGIYEMNETTYREIDEPADWDEVASLIIKKKNGCLCTIKLLAMDVDGVLTDAGMYYDNSGNEAKKFNTRDGKGIELIRNAGIKTAIITSEDTEIVSRRAKKLKIDYLFQGVKEKYRVLQELAARLQITLEEIAYIGDDLNDLEVLQHLPASFCPSDAVAAVRQNAKYIMQAGGGNGCVREVCDLLLAKRGKNG